MYKTIAIDKTVEAMRERESYFLNNMKFACVKQSILNKNRITKGRVI